MAEVKKTSAKKTSPARPRRTAHTRRASAKKSSASVPVNDDTDKKPLPGVGQKASTARQRGVLRDCLSSLQKVADACHPLSVWGVLGLLCAGAVIGVLAFIGAVSVTESPTLTRLLEGTTDKDNGLHRSPTDISAVDLDEFWEVWRNIEEHFVPRPERYSPEETGGQETPDDDDLIRGAIDGLTQATGDRYTNFFLPKDAEDFESQVIEGEVEGIGAYITTTEDGRLIIVKPISDSPAMRAGLRPDDVILTIDGVSSSVYNLAEAADAIRGLRGSTVSLSVYRPSSDETFSLDIVRDQVEIPTIETEIHGGVFVIRLSTFTRQTPRAFRDALRQFERAVHAGVADRILLDLRGNMGGILSVAVYISGLFVQDGSPVLYEYTGSDRLKAYRTKNFAFEKRVLPIMTVLVDGASASAAEILAAALRHYGIADIVGTQTLGKGSIQALKSVGSRSLLKVTVAHWLTPDRMSVDEIGITPDVDYLEEVRETLEDKPDLDIDQFLFQKALRHIQSR